jgi:hypothetical protein
VIARLAEANHHQAVVVRGEAAISPVWVHSERQPCHALIRAIGRSLRLVEVKTPTTLSLMPGAAALRARRARYAAECPPHWSMRRLSCARPEAVARLVAHALLSCHGRAFPVPSRQELLIEDDSEVQEQVVAVCEAVSHSTGTATITGTAYPRDIDFGLLEVPAEACRAGTSNGVALRSRLARSPDLAMGEPAGAMVIAAARRADTDLVVGCGGDRAAYGHFDSLAPAVIASEVGLHMIGDERAPKYHRSITIVADRGALVDEPAPRLERPYLFLKMRDAGVLAELVNGLPRVNALALGSALAAPGIGWVAIRADSDERSSVSCAWGRATRG